MNKSCIELLILLFFSLACLTAKAQDRAVSHTPVLSELPKDSIPAPVAVAPDFPKDSIRVSADTTAIDSTSSKSAIDAPVQYQAQDSIVMLIDQGNFIYLYGDGEVKYKNLELTGEYIEVDADNNTVYSTFGLDSIGSEFGYPVFKEGEAQYEMKKMRYNFKTKKGFITDVITEQGEGYVTAGKTKKMANDDLYMVDGKYTTCDDHDHPHFYFNLTKAKATPGKNIVTGPAYLVVEGVSLPIFIPFGFFPFTSEYTSGIIMPTFGDEMSRGFSLRDGGYYFAINDNIDLALTGEVYTKGTWGVNARSNYRKRYKYSGNFNAGYLVTVTGDKDTPDYYKSNDLKVAWSHSQDSKASPFHTLSANVNFSTSQYDRNSVSSIYGNSATGTLPSYTQNTKSSSVNYSQRFPGKPLTINANMTVNQQSRDSIINLTLPNMTITLSDIYPFRRKEQVGNARWYEAVRLSYTGILMNSVRAKEYDILKTNLIKDWKNGMKHTIPVSASFNLLKYITISPSVNYESRWYTTKIEEGYDYSTRQLVPVDTANGFYRIYDYNASIGANSKLYGYYKPMKFLGDKVQMIRHVLTPSVSFSAAPDFGNPKYGYYQDINYYNPATGLVDTVTYSPFQNNLWGVPGQGKSGSMNFSLDNNLEMKVKAGEDSVKKISIIDNLGLRMGYNFLAESFKWSNLNASIRLKLTKSFTLNLQGVFDTYTYNDQGIRQDIPRWEAGKGLGRLMTTGTSFSYSLNNDVLKKWFGGGDDKNKTGSDTKKTTSAESEDGEEDTGDGTTEEPAKRKSLREGKKSEGEFDSDGYMVMNVPWNLSFNYSMNLGYDKTMKDGRYTEFHNNEFGYKITQTLGISGSIQPSKGWNFTFNTSYDFDYKRFATMQCSVTRNLHCWQMTASIIPIGPYQMYNFTISVNSSLLKDFKYNQSSNYRDAIGWD